MVRTTQRASRSEGRGCTIESAVGKSLERKGVGSGVFEYRIDFGPGYRIYFGKDGDRLVILLGGGSKQKQQRDIQVAIKRWADYKLRKR